MKYISDASYEYISNKYHDTAKPFDSFKRFIRRDEIFAEDTGMDGALIREGILAQDREIAHLPHPVRKARAFAYVLKNTRISCDPRDLFPAINAIDRPLNDTIVSRWNQEVFEQLIPEAGRERSEMNRLGVANVSPDYDHSIPVWERIFALGFSGLLSESERIRQLKKRTAEENAFFEGIRITYEAIVDLIGRLAELAARTPGSEKMAQAFTHIQHNPPATFYEALLTDYLYFMLSEHIEGLQVRSLCNFDRVFYPYYQSDLASGVTEEEIRTQLAYFFMQFTAIANYWNQPVYLGGCSEDESTVVNELTYLFLDVYDQMGIYNPKVQLKVAPSTPKEVICKALDMIRRGNNCIVFVSDTLIRRALMNAGVSADEARMADVRGCYDYAVQGALVCGMTYVNLLKPLEYVLHRGCDGVTGSFAGLKGPELSELDTMEKLYAEYVRQLSQMTDRAIRTVNTYDDYLDYVNPQSMLSATYPTALEKARDALDGGASRNDSSINFGFLADAADSMAMIQKYVYDRKELTLAQLRDILDCNYEGYESLRARLLADRDKYGNNRELPDGYAVRIVQDTTAMTQGRPNAVRRGGRWGCGYHVARMSYSQAGNTAASPNGRKRGEELSKNCSASMGRSREGATAAILSVTKLDASAFTSSACLDLGLLPSAVRGEEGLEAMYQLLMTFLKRGGQAVHINVFDADTLRDAQQHPEKYQDLQIRVCGWNVLWNNINRVEQDGFIRQAESLI